LWYLPVARSLRTHRAKLALFEGLLGGDLSPWSLPRRFDDQALTILGERELLLDADLDISVACGHLLAAFANQCTLMPLSLRPELTPAAIVMIAILAPIKREGLDD
jgi:hypothetical protein